MIEGWYYLHTNGDLIYKIGSFASGDIRDSPFAVGLWPFDPTSRESAWMMVIEALAAGAKRGRVLDLMLKWGLSDDDALNLANRIGFSLVKDGNQWMATRSDFINLQESPAGFGDTCLDACADLAKTLGYKPSKMWGSRFKDLIQVEK